MRRVRTFLHLFLSSSSRVSSCWSIVLPLTRVGGAQVKVGAGQREYDGRLCCGQKSSRQKQTPWCQRIMWDSKNADKHTAGWTVTRGRLSALCHQNGVHRVPPVSLRRVQLLSRVKIGEVPVVGPHKDRMSCSFQPLSPFLEGKDNG